MARDEADKIKFYLRSANKKGQAPIYIRYYCKDGDFRYPTEEVIDPQNWDASGMQAYLDKRLNARLYQIQNILEQYLAFCERMGKRDLYKKDLEKELNEKLGRMQRAEKAPKASGKPKVNFFYDSLDKIIDQCAAGEILTPKLTKYQSGSIRNFKKLKNTLFKFNANIDFNTINIELYQEFVKWCNKKQYTINYIGSLIKEWKTLMELSFSQGYHKNLIYRHKDFKKIDEDVYKTYLTDDEIELLYKYNLEHVPYLETIRDRFVVNLYSGLRISDMQTLTINNISRGMMVHVNKKTGKRVVVPLHPTIKEIIKKYKDDLPKQYHMNVVNREIKEIAKAAGLTELVHYTRTEGGVRKTFAEPKYKLITNHTARRTLTSNLLKHTDMQSAMPVLGMSLKTIQKYNKRTSEENAIMLQSNPFFAKK